MMCRAVNASTWQVAASLPRGRMMEISKLLQEGAAALERSGVEDAENEARVLLGYCLDMSRTDLFLHGRDKVTKSRVERYGKLVERRGNREPYAYITGEKEFWSLPFHVDRNVLIPRPETEFLLEVVLERVRREAMGVDRAIDLCCGSGVIAVVLASELKASILALDISDGALRITARNSRRHGVEQLVYPVSSNLLSAVGEGQGYPLIVSNPPYVSRREIEEDLQPEVACHEPVTALDGGADGLQVIRRLADDVLRQLKPDGLFAMEHGAGQAENIKDIFSRVRWQGRRFTSLETYRDYSGHDRVLLARAG